jgi:four helix bundle protein
MIAEIKSYKDLKIWQKANALVNKIFDLIEVFPKNIGGDVIARQVIRSSTSIAANIAEGYGGRKGSEYVSYLYQARKSIPETDYWLYLASQRRFVTGSVYEELSKEYSEILLMINSTISKLRRQSEK